MPNTNEKVSRATVEALASVRRLNESTLTRVAAELASAVSVARSVRW